MGKFIPESRRDINRSWREEGMGSHCSMDMEFLFEMMK